MNRCHLAGRSAQQCGPRTFGLPRIAEDMAGLDAGEVEDGDAPATLTRLRCRIGLMPDRNSSSVPRINPSCVGHGLFPELIGLDQRDHPVLEGEPLAQAHDAVTGCPSLALKLHRNASR